MPHPVVAPMLVWLGRLSYPRLFIATAILFFVSLLFPDPIPFVDELLLGLGTLLLANFKNRNRKPEEPSARPPIDGTARKE